MWYLGVVRSASNGRDFEVVAIVVREQKQQAWKKVDVAKLSFSDN